MIPAVAAGGIIGKGGETIAQLQTEVGAKIKMSKANDFYPGIFTNFLLQSLFFHILGSLIVLCGLVK